MNFADFTRECEIKIYPRFDNITGDRIIRVVVYFGNKKISSDWSFITNSPITYDEAIHASQLELYQHLQSLYPHAWDPLTSADRLSGLVKKETKNEN